MSAAAADLTYGGLKYRTFALAPQTGHTTSSRFLLATSSLVEPNVVHVVELNEEDEEVVCVNVFPHSHAVSAIAASPNDASLVLTSFVSTNGECLLLSVWLIAFCLIDESVERVHCVFSRWTVAYGG